MISDGVRMLRSVRDMARNATNDLSRELGTDVKLEDLHPKTFIRKHLLSEEDEATLRRPFDDAYQQVKGIADDVNETTGRRPADPPAPRPSSAPTQTTGQPTPPVGQGGYPPATSDPGQPYTGTGYGQVGYTAPAPSTAWGESGYGGSAPPYGQPGPGYTAPPRHAAEPYDDDAT